MADNDNKSPRELEPVAKGQLSKNRDSMFKIMFDEIFVKNFQEMRTTFVREVIVPRTMDWLLDMGTNILNDLFRTNVSSPGRYYSSGRNDYTKHYKGSSSGYSGRERRESKPREDDIRDWEQLCFNSRSEAERVISSMIGTINEYGVVSIADLFGFSGVDSSWADNKYGWANLDKARSFRGGDGKFYLDLPEPLPIDED